MRVRDSNCSRESLQIITGTWSVREDDRGWYENMSRNLHEVGECSFFKNGDFVFFVEGRDGTNKLKTNNCSHHCLPRG